MKQNLLDNIPKELHEELFSNVLESKHFRVERIVSKGHSSAEGFWYEQASSEWILLIQGSARLQFEGEEELYLKKGDYLNIPAHAKHRVTWTDPSDETIWLAIHYGE